MEKAFFWGRLPLPPGVNQSYKPIVLTRMDQITGEKRTHASIGGTPDLKVFQEAAGWELQTAHKDQPMVEHIKYQKRKRKQTPLALTMTFFYATLWLHDEDSGIKAVQDVIFDHLGLNDNLVIDLIVKKRACREDPHVEFSLSLADIT